MRPDMVVMVAPVVDFFSRVIKAGEPVKV